MKTPLTKEVLASFENENVKLLDYEIKIFEDYSYSVIFSYLFKENYQLTFLVNFNDDGILIWQEGYYYFEEMKNDSDHLVENIKNYLFTLKEFRLDYMFNTEFIRIDDFRKYIAEPAPYIKGMRDTEQVLFHLYRIGKTIDEIHQMSEYHPVIIAHYLSDIYFKLKENKIKVESFEVESLTEIVSLYQNGFYNKSRKK